MAYQPIIKEKGFSPNPVAKYGGIPAYADSVANPNVVGTLAHKQWWEEQFEYCLNGYDTGGLHIPGRHYYYLNFNYISTVGRGNHYPDYVDADYEFFTLVDRCKEEGKGLITIKARRRGMSEKWAKGIAGYGVRFENEGYRAGVVAGLATYSEGLYTKYLQINGNVAPELYMHHIGQNQEEWIAGYYKKNQQGAFVRGGDENSIVAKTANKNPNVLKGNLFNDVAFEEAGEFDLLIRTYGATKDCFQDGDMMVGTPYIYGTGGNISTQSAGFMKMWYEAEFYNLLKFELYGPRLRKPCFVGATDKNGEINEDCPNILDNPENSNLSYEQMLGCEDVAQAYKKNMEKRRNYFKSTDRKLYFDEIQNNPNDDREAFLKFGANPFDSEILSNRASELAEKRGLSYRRFKLDYRLDSDTGLPVLPKEIISTELEDGVTDPYEIWLAEGVEPLPDVRNIDIVGIDSYDVDEAMSSKSLGGITVLRRDNGISGQPKMKVVAFIRKRPPRKETLWELGLRTSIFFNTRRNTLIDYGKPGIIDYYKRNGGKGYLAPRPRSFESADSKQSHDFGVLLTLRSKPMMISLLQSYVLDFGHTIDFPILVQELLDYDVEAKDSDWDGADSLGIALMRDKDMRQLPVDLGESDDDPFALPEIAYDVNGNPYYKAGVSSAGIHYSKYEDETMQLLVKKGLW